MTDSPKYRKLPGRGTRFEGHRWIAAFRKRCRLWLAKDHVLLVLSTSFSEEFKRFYLRDIQAITVRKTNAGRNSNIALGTIAAIFAALAFAFPNPVPLGVFGTIAGIFLVLMLINAAGGPTCIAEIKTAAQTEELSSLQRLRAARKTLGILRPLIEQAQGTVPPPRPPNQSTPPPINANIS